MITKRKIIRGFVLFLFFCLCFGAGHFTAQRGYIATSAINEEKAMVAIVIDDLGYHGEGTEEILSVSIPLTVAIMPFSSNSQEDYALSTKAGKEVIIHLPMEALIGKKSWVGDKGIFRSMSSEEIQARVEEALSILPNAVGINNHMGSAIMEDKQALSSVFDVIKKHDLFFLDSVTSPNSLGETIAKEKGIPFLKRNVFLDGTNDIELVKKNLKETVEIAKENGSAIAIGHVGPEGGVVTAQAIAELAPELEKEGVQFVTLTELLEAQNIQ